MSVIVAVTRLRSELIGGHLNCFNWYSQLAHAYQTYFTLLADQE